MPRAYYSEIDKNCVKVLKQLIADDIIPDGDVDDRSIAEVEPDDLDGYTQCHFFAGGGLWAVAGRLAGWPDDRPVWTGSCPCQPHSAAASDRKLGFADPRDLWPTWFRLVEIKKPGVVFGEQVDDNTAWIDRMRSDMEGAGYAVAPLDLPACAVDAPHLRMRTFFVADADGSGRGEQGGPEPVEAQHFPAERAGSGSCFSDHRTTGELGRVRRSEPGVRLLSDDVPGRVALLRIAGNAINPELAAALMSAYQEGK